MKIIDTNGLDFIFSKNSTLADDYFLVPDVKEESEMTELRHNKSLPANLLEITRNGAFNEANYLSHYSAMLNKYDGRSFFNMTGFGDISILAATHMLLDAFRTRKQRTLFNSFESIEIYTDDKPLVKKIEAEFAGQNVGVKAVADIR